MNRNYKALELDKILELLAAETTFEEAAAEAKNLVPSTNIKHVKRLMDDTFSAWQFLTYYDMPSFGRIKNMNVPLDKAASGATLQLKELLKIGEILKVVRSIIKWRKKAENFKNTLDNRFSALAPNKYLEEKINHIVISDEEIADNASPDLSRIRRKIRSASLRIRDQLNKMIHSSAFQKYLQDPVVTMRSDRFVVPVKAEFRNQVPGLIHDSSASGATVFVEPMSVVETNNELKVLQSEEKNEIERIIYELSVEVGEYSENIKADFEILVELNVIFAKARLAFAMKSTVPNIVNTGIISLNQARHPLIDKKSVVPIDVELGKDFDTLVITGPNTGGKTVTLKTIGLLTLMTMCGLMPPVNDNSTISVFSNIFVDIGDEQSIEQSLSTFSSHMTNIIGILDKADSNSLILMDELGAGTDPVEGAALGIAILENLRSKESIIAATTHYPELKAFAISTKGVENGSCEFNIKTLRPTYCLLIGVPGRSNAFAISKRLGMTDDIIERAKKLVSSDKQDLEGVISKLEESREDLEEELKRARDMRQKSEVAKIRAEDEFKKTETLHTRELKKAEDKARLIVENARFQADRLLVEIDEIQKEKRQKDFANTAQKARKQLEKGLDSLDKASRPVMDKLSNSSYTLPRPLMMGDEVLIVDIDKKAHVIFPPDNKGSVTVRAGIITTHVHVDNLKLIETGSSFENKKIKTSTKSRKRGVSHSERADKEVKREIDIRGKNIEEGVLELDQFIDNNILSGLTTLTIIHGKGTGMLRSGIQRHLRSHPAIKTFRTGSFGEGEDGVTIAEMK